MSSYLGEEKSRNEKEKSTKENSIENSKKVGRETEKRKKGKENKEVGQVRW